MKISREIIINGMSNNTEYELTGIELERAYNEYVENHDKGEVIHQLEDLEYEGLEDIPEEIIADLASQVRDKMDALMDDVVLSVIHKNEDKLKEYKDKWKVFTKTVRVEVEKEYTIKAKNEEDADALWEKWFERNGQQVIDDLSEEIDTQNFDEDDPEEDEHGDPDYADINEENARW